ncbi:MAG: RidA family protein [Pseudomonadota bacterium]
MLPRRRFHPEGHLSIGVPGFDHFSHGLACGQMIFTSGQADISGEAQVTRPNDLVAQTRIAAHDILKVLDGLGADGGDLVKLTGFYVKSGLDDEDVILAELSQILGEGGAGRNGRPGPCVTLVPIETNCFRGLTIEIEATAMRGHNGERLPRASAWIPDGSHLPPTFSQAMRCEEMLFTSGQTAWDPAGELKDPGSLVSQSWATLGKLNRLLKELGADLHDSVKTNVFNVEPGKMEEWSEAAMVRAAHYKEPGPAATGLSIPRLDREGVMVRNDVIAMRGKDGSRLARRGVWPDGHWDWPVHLPYRHGVMVGDMVFIGGQVSLTPDAQVIDPGNIEAQTHRAMENIEKVLAEFGLRMENLVKVNAFYVGTEGEDDLATNAGIRAGYYRPPGPVSTGMSFPYLAYQDMLIEIDAVAMV